MQIDWITVTAQIVNFLVLVYLLKRFLYQPVIRAMDRREQRITQRLEQAEEREREAEDQAQHYRDEQNALKQRREALIDEAEQEADKRREQLIDEARRDAEQLRQRWQEEVEKEKTQFIAGLRDQAAHAITRIARRAFEDLADTQLEAQTVRGFLRELEALDESTRDALAQEAEEGIDIITAFELDDAMRNRISEQIRAVVGQAAEIRFERSRDIVCGVELRAGGHKIGWNLDRYLRVIEQAVDERFAQVSAG